MNSHPAPQRQLRGHMPTRPTSRIATTGQHHAQLASRLTLRDRWLARMLYEHRVFTSHQITQLCFPTARATNHRLLDLYTWRFLDRFQPFVSVGTAPMHYVLDIAGAVALAYEDGLDPKHIGYRHEDAIGIAHSLRLAHTVGINSVFTPLVALSRQPGARGRLSAWWSERRCARLFGDIVRPDAYGRWREDGQELEWFLEFDFGTENLAVLASKLDDYHHLATSTGIVTPLLVWLPGNRREIGARRALSVARAQLDRPDLVPVLTTAADVAATTGDTSAAGARWLPLGQPTPAASSPRSGSPASVPPTGRWRLLDIARRWPYQPGTAESASANSAPVEGGLGHLAPPAPLPPAPQPTRFRR